MLNSHINDGLSKKKRMDIPSSNFFFIYYYYNLYYIYKNVYCIIIYVTGNMDNSGILQNT
jgi:hypothetical protein